jgi:predicted O-methyltransferase YrrM
MAQRQPLYRRIARRWVEDTRLGRLAYKAYVLTNHYPKVVVRKPVDSLRFLLFDPECANFTYEIANYDELNQFLCRTVAKGGDAARLAAYADELRNDRELEGRLKRRLAGRSDRKPIPLYGRRVGWYAAVRQRRPKLVIETGVSDGLGSAVLLRAVERNAAEGAPARVIGIDIDPRAGWLLDEEMRRRHELIIDDSQAALPRVLAGQTLDFFIHDSNHHYEHELGEYQIVRPHLAPEAVIFSDNAHAVPALRDFSASEGRRFDFFKERPLDHFYEGAGIGASVRA